MKSTKLFLVVVLFLASCSAPASPAPTAILQPVLTATLTPAPTATQTPAPTPTRMPLPTQVGGGSGRLIFTYKKDEFIKAFPALKGETNVFVANIDGTNLTPVTNGLEGYNYLKDISPDGTKVLIASTSKDKNKDSNLYLVNLNSLDSEPTKLADGLPNNYGRNSAAKWIDNTKIVYVGKGDAGFGIYKINADGTNPINIDTKGSLPFEILAISGTRIYWDTLVDRVEGGNRHFSKYYVWWSSLDGPELGTLEFNGEKMFFTNVFGRSLVFSPDGTQVAWIEGATATVHHNYLQIASVSDMNHPYTMKAEPLTSSLILKWWPDGSKVFVFDLGAVTEIFGHSMDTTSEVYGIYEVLITPDLTVKNYRLPRETMGGKTKITGGYNTYSSDFYDISPDGRLMICAVYEKNANGNFDTQLKFLNLETLIFSDANGFVFSNTSGDGLHWIP